MEKKKKNKEKNHPESADFETYRNAWRVGAITNRIACTPDFQTPKRRDKKK